MNLPFDLVGRVGEAFQREVLDALPSDPRSATGDTLARVDAALAGLCPCGAHPQPGSAYCGEDCRPTHRGPDTDAPWLGGPHAARWRPDLVTAFDEPDLELVEELAPDRRVEIMTGRPGLTRRWYRHTDGRRFLRLDDGHRWVGAYAELADGPQVELWRRLERELADPRRLDPDATEEPDLPPIVCMRCGDLHPSPPPELCRCGLEVGFVRDGLLGNRRLPVELVAGPENMMMVQIRGRADLRVRWQLTDAYLELPGSVEERIDRAWVELQHQLRGMLRDGTVPPVPAVPEPATSRDPAVPTLAERAAAYADLAAAGTVFWPPNPPADPGAPTAAELAGGVELGTVARRSAQPAATGSAMDRVVGPTDQLRAGDRISLHWSNAGSDRQETTELAVSEVRPDGSAVTEPVDRERSAERIRQLGQQVYGLAGAAVFGAPAHQRLVADAARAESDRVALRAVCADEEMYERALAAARERGWSVTQMFSFVAEGRYTEAGWCEAAELSERAS